MTISIPSNLLELAKTKLLTLKIVEIIGEDEPNQLDRNNFLCYLLNQTI